MAGLNYLQCIHIVCLLKTNKSALEKLTSDDTYRPEGLGKKPA
jgi:hypothetical protein